jgi:hypothetical protein
VDEWTSHVDPDSGRGFLFNIMTGESKWIDLQRELPPPQSNGRVIAGLHTNLYDIPQDGADDEDDLYL